MSQTTKNNRVFIYQEQEGVEPSVLLTTKTEAEELAKSADKYGYISFYNAARNGAEKKQVVHYFITKIVDEGPKETTEKGSLVGEYLKTVGS